MSLDTMQDLLIAELRDIYSAEKQILKALPKMAKAAESSALKKAFTSHLTETKGHVARLEQIFKSLEKRPGGKKCKGMEGLLKEGSEMCEEDGEDAVRDAGIISAAQRVEHYEIAAYGCAIAFAESLGENKIAGLLKQTRDEEEAADDKLTSIADGEVNPAAVAAGEEGDEDEE